MKWWSLERHLQLQSIYPATFCLVTFGLSHLFDLFNLFAFACLPALEWPSLFQSPPFAFRLSPSAADAWQRYLRYGTVFYLSSSHPTQQRYSNGTRSAERRKVKASECLPSMTVSSPVKRVGAPTQRTVELRKKGCGMVVPHAAPHGRKPTTNSGHIGEHDGSVQPHRP